MRPVPGKDAQWLAMCKACDDMTLYASRGGFRNGGTEHCYTCGAERPIRGMRQDDIDRMVLSSRFHWDKFALIPYDWHQLSEDERWRVLWTKKQPIASWWKLW